ncbi:hypothetical protein COLO4_20899 [Corchorus olitorius]|uniref:Uncharacterized protein n=1 Tax=Corchorus olitorius TaxID=93759 RepID=A0A1R3IW90_9ROSI|nr:hypothetical protein COLO4_20899 [Corchorus olitorius]
MDKGKKHAKEGNKKKKSRKDNKKLTKKVTEKELKIASELKEEISKFAEGKIMKLLNESPCDEVPYNHFRNNIHRIRYDDIFEFNLTPATTIDWNTLSQNPVYVKLHEKFVTVNWMGIVQFENVQVSKSMVKEFLTGIIIDKKGILLEDRFAQNRKFMYVHICGKENVITTSILGQALNIEYLEGQSQPLEDFDVNAAWGFINGNDEIFPTLRSERKLLKPEAKLTLQFIRNNIWFDNQEHITEKEVWDFKEGHSHLTALSKETKSVSSSNNAPIMKELQGLRTTGSTSPTQTAKTVPTEDTIVNVSSSDDEEEEAQKTQSSEEEESSEEQDTEKEESENDAEETNEEGNSDDEVDEEI